MSEENQEHETEDYYGFGAPIPQEKHNVHSFLKSVATSQDTTKLGNLTSEELGTPKYPLRTYKELALISDKIMNNSTFNDFYEAKCEILTSTSLSKDAKLINLAVIQKRQIEDQTRSPRTENKGWFKKKSDNEINSGDNI